MKHLCLAVLPLMIVACGGSESFTETSTTGQETETKEEIVSEEMESEETAARSLYILASNIVLSKAYADETVDMTKKVLAENVQLKIPGNRLRSETLQEALDTELAVKASDHLIGSWNCYDGSMNATGKIRLDAYRYYIKEGYCMHLGPVPGAGCRMPLTYEVLQNSFLQVDTNSNYQEYCDDYDVKATGTTTYFLTEITTTKIVLWMGGSQIYVLTK